MIHRAIKYRLYPTAKQAALFINTFGCCRKVYNLMLSDKIASYKDTGSFGYHTPAMYKDSHPYLREVDSLALANVQLHLQQALKNCFVSGHCMFPTFKSAKRSRKSYTTNNQNGTIAVFENAIKLPKTGKVRAVIHRTPDVDWKIKSATISQDADGKFYASVLYEYETDVTPVPKESTSALGLDYKSDGLYMDNNGRNAGMPKYYRESHRKLAKEQRRLSRMTGFRKGESKSSNYRKQQQKLARIHKHIANQRLDRLHKLSAEIANQYDIVCVESINMRALSNKSFGNGKSTFDNGYGLFLQMLEYKLSDRGKHFVKVDKWYPSSQLCSCCDNRQKLALKDRVYICPHCGLTIDRDHNAAINILNEGLRILKEDVA